jgi:hypothetical protein
VLPSSSCSSSLKEEEGEQGYITCRKESLEEASVTEDNRYKFINLFKLVTKEDKLVYLSTTKNHQGKLYVDNRYITKEEFANYSLAWMLCITNFDKEVPNRLPEHQSTVNYNTVNEQYQKLTKTKSYDKKRIWIMHTLVRLGIIIMRNPNWDYEKHISRKFSWSWAQLQELLVTKPELIFPEMQYYKGFKARESQPE